MKDFKILIALCLVIIFQTSTAQEIKNTPQYHLKVDIIPETHELSVKAEILNPDDSAFFLCRNLSIIKFEGDGKPLKYSRKQGDMMANSSEVTFWPNKVKKLVIEYQGKILADSFPKIISQVNMIKPRLVELAIYTTWYPRFKNSHGFNFELQVKVPANYVTVTNGRMVKQKQNQDKNISYWESIRTVWDILLFSAPNMKKSSFKANDLEVELYYDKIPVSYIDSIKINLMKSMELLKNNISNKMNNNLIRVVFSPRAGWGYVRTPFIIVDESNALYNRGAKFGQARNFRYITHEIAHYWWSIASSSTPEDWINEGLAEYSALWISEIVYGKEFAYQLVKEYTENANGSNADIAIAETPNNSQFREVNRYTKPALLLHEVGEKYGRDSLLKFLSKFYAKCLQSKEVNTKLFLNEAESCFGKDARTFLEEALYRKRWNSQNSLKSCAYLPKDSIFKGTWTGILTQSGFSQKVVLHLNVSDNQWVPAIDSPDQNVFNIPISEFSLTSDTLQFKIAVASVLYTGRYDEATKSISGNWLQKGVDYSLSLQKSEKQ